MSPSTGTKATPVMMCTRPKKVAVWLSEQGETVAAPVTVERIGFGQSNITSVVHDRDNRQWVLCEPPAGTRHGNAHDVHREAGIIAGLADSDVPVAWVVGTGQTRGDGIFFVMQRVPGAPLECEADAGALTPAQRYALGVQVITTLATLHRTTASFFFDFMLN